MSLRTPLARAGGARVLGAYLDLRERILARRVATADSDVGPDGLPLPPPRLLVRTTGEARSHDWYLSSGQHDIATIEELLATAGRSAGDLEAVLDFGCGCGRVARKWHRRGPRVLGCDIDPRMVAWCNRALPFMEARVSSTAPPAPFENGSVDLVYAFSVFTHLPDPLQRPWLRDLRRLLRSGGLVIFTMLGTSFAREHLKDGELERFEGGELVVREPELVGTYCLAFAGRAWVEAALREAGLELIEHRPGPVTKKPSQDLYVARPA